MGLNIMGLAITDRHILPLSRLPGIHADIMGLASLRPIAVT